MIHALLLITVVTIGLQSLEWWIGEGLPKWVERTIFYATIWLIVFLLGSLVETLLAIFYGTLLGVILSTWLGLMDKKEKTHDQ